MSSNNNENEFTKVLSEHKALIYKIAYGYSKNNADLEDLVQEIALQLWRSFAKYDPRYKKSTWIYRIALNTAISSLRKTTSHAKYHTPEDVSLYESKMISEDNSAMHDLNQILGRLGKFDRALVMLHLDGLTHGEIAEVLDISVSNVGTKISRIKRYLAEQL